MHLLDDVAPADAGVVGAEGNLTLLRGIRDDAHLGAAEVVVEQILEPHARDEQEVPAIRAAYLDVPLGSVRADAPIIVPSRAERLVEFLQQIDELEVGRRLERVVVLHQRQRHTYRRQEFAPAGVVDVFQILGDRLRVEERRDRDGLLRLLVDHHRHADAAVRVAPAREIAPFRARPVYEVSPVGERAHERDREPVAHRLAETNLLLDVVRQVRERVALRGAAIVRHFFIASRERHRLERQEVDLLRIVQRKLDDPANLLVVHAVDDRGYRNDVHTRGVQVLNCAELDVEEVAHQTMRVGGVADTIELQIGIAQARLKGGPGEFRTLGEFDTVGRGLNAAVPDLLRVPHRIQEVRRHRRFATRELDRHLAFRLDRDRVVEQRLDVFPRELVHEADLIGIHEARIAHHIAAVRQVDRQHRAAAVLDRARTVIVQLLVVMRADVAARKRILEVLEERRIDRHDVLEVPVLRAVLDHQDLAVAFDDVRLDLANLLVEKDLVVALAVQDLLARFADAFRAERVGLARPAKWRLHLLPGLQDRFVRPFGRERLRWRDAVQRIEYRPGPARRDGQSLLEVLNRLVHMPPQRPAAPSRMTTPSQALGRSNPAVRICPELPESLSIQANGQDQGVNWLKTKGKGKRENGKVAGEKDYAVTRCVFSSLADLNCHRMRKPSSNAMPIA